MIDTPTTPGLKGINTEMRLYLIPVDTKGSFSTLGFDVAQRWAESMASVLGIAAPDPATKGTPEHYLAYRAISDELRRSGKKDLSDLTPQLIGLEGKRVEVEDEDGNTRRFWVGRSMGWRPCHIEVLRADSTGGIGVYGAPFKSVRVVRKDRRY